MPPKLGGCWTCTHWHGETTDQGLYGAHCILLHQRPLYSPLMKRRRDIMKLPAAFALSLALSGSAMAFEVDGIRSGMSVADLRKVAASRHLELWSVGEGSWLMGRSANYEIAGSFGFCGPRGLNAYSRSIDPDQEYATQVERTIGSHGQPKVSVTRTLWNGPGGGEVVGVEMQWRDGETRTTLSFIPEGPDGKGNLRHNRAASLSIADMTRLCDGP